MRCHLCGCFSFRVGHAVSLSSELPLVPTWSLCLNGPHNFSVTSLLCRYVSSSERLKFFIQANWVARSKVPKESSRRLFHPLEVLMWQFDGHLSLRRVSLSSGSDVPDGTSITWSSCPQQYQRWTWKEDRMTLNKQLQRHLTRPPRQATCRLCCWAPESVLLVEGKLIVAGTWASFCNKIGVGGNYLPVILNLTYIILLQALWTCLCFPCFLIS